MKKILIVLITPLLFACADNEKTVENEVASEVKKAKVFQQKETASSALIPTVDFEAFNSEYLQKKNDTTYIINFWATWCKPCIEELPAFERINEEYSGQKVKVVLTSLDFPDRLEKQVIPFIKKYELQSEVVLLDDPDANSWIPKVSEQWSGAIPATIIYNQQERKFYERSFTYDELKSELTSIL
ncbi:TlpA disulfide reductase family protein [Salinimicrobium sp. HB62]|uniref:TlpA disulfide reductase family protein n=1 Tax=Salinimicrobium sp. HB62 TaxID=3077781 RepID=UPI002D78A093|nr:TlpA disulfide reductase family protein [Salinimicrobium sp. HB62]